MGKRGMEGATWWSWLLEKKSRNEARTSTPRIALPAKDIDVKKSKVGDNIVVCTRSALKTELGLYIHSVSSNRDTTSISGKIRGQ